MGDTTKAREVLLSKKSKFEDAFQYKALNPSLSTKKLAEMFGVDRSGLHRYITKRMSEQESTQGIHNAKNAVMEIKNGLDTLKNLQESTNQRDVEISQKAIKTLEEYYPEMKSVFASIQNRLLSALDRETQRMEVNGELDLKGIAQAQAVVKMVQDTNYFNQKAPMVAVQNNIQNNNANGSLLSNGSNQGEVAEEDRELKIVYEIVTAPIQDNESESENADIEGEIVD